MLGHLPMHWVRQFCSYHLVLERRTEAPLIQNSGYLRTLLIQGAQSMVLTHREPADPIFEWAKRLRERCGWQKAVVALANKNARILWVVMTKRKRFNVHHVSVHPSAAMPAGA